MDNYDKAVAVLEKDANGRLVKNFAKIKNKLTIKTKAEDYQSLYDGLTEVKAEYDEIISAIAVLNGGK